MSTNSIYTLNLSTANFNYTQSLEIHAKQDDDNALIAYPRAHIDNHQAPHYIYWSKASNKTFTLMKPPTTYGKLLLDHTSLYLPKCRPPSDFRYEVTIENRGSRNFWENSRSRIVFSVSFSDCFFGMEWLLKIEEVGFFGKILVLGLFFRSRSRIVFFGMKWLLKIEEVGFFGKILVLGVFSRLRHFGQMGLIRNAISMNHRCNTLNIHIMISCRGKNPEKLWLFMS